MTKLHQIVAAEGGEKARANKATAPLFHAAKNGNLFSGLTKTYEPASESDEDRPDESVRVQFTVDGLLRDFARASGRLLDLTWTKENANTGARADVVLDGAVLIAGAPVIFLMPFEKWLEQEVRGLLVSLPVLDPAQDWSPSGAERAGVSETGTIKRLVHRKTTEVITLAPATDKHPAQVQLAGKDVVAGSWAEKKFSGAVTASRKQQLIERLEDLIVAVKYAREKANDVEVEDRRVAAEVFGYLFA